MASPSRAGDTPARRPHALPPIRTFLGAELTLPLPAPRDDPRMDIDPRESLFAPSLSRPPFPLLTPPTIPSPHSAPVPSHPRPTRSPAPRPHSSPSQSAPAYSYVLRPSPSGGFITSIPTARPRARSFFHLPAPAQPPSAPPSSSSSSTTKRARAESDGARRHVCPVCQKRFNRPSTLRTHENVHTGRRPFACPACNKVFSVASNMRRHLLRAHARGGGGAPEPDSDDLDADEQDSHEEHLEWAPAYQGPP